MSPDRTVTVSNNRLQPTAYSVRSCVAPASGSSSGLAFDMADNFPLMTLFGINKEELGWVRSLAGHEFQLM